MTERTIGSLALVGALACAGGCAAGGGARPSGNDDIRVLADALADRVEFRARLAKSCSEVVAIDEVIEAAISIGAPIFNAGSPLGCYRIYEGAAYKVLYRLGDGCADAAAVLRAGLTRSESDTDVATKAWTMRRAFDVLQGKPTRSGNRGPRPAP